MDRFPEAFARFEEVVDVRKLQSFDELREAFEEWAGYTWIPTGRQLHALSIQAEGLGLLHRAPTWRVTYVTVRGRPQERFRDIRSGRFVKRG
jgi:hypothetical protein